MPESIPCPLTRREIADAYFLEHRAKLLDIAAFLDRIDRAADDDGDEDFRISAIRSCLAMLIDGEGDRARRVLDQLSDHSTEPLDTAPMKGALGAPPPDGAGS
ncbi:MAG: hypothetical protein MK116_10320 [Phycisphaerales bacterium]|nr:hypothetical protein [Phycisphaerales bacterium]